MSTQLLLNNVALYSLQVGLLIGVAAFVPALLRLRHPAARLVFWHVLLAACLLLPLVRPWKQALLVVPQDAAIATVTITSATTAAPAAAPRLTPGGIVLALLAAGGMVRLGWLGIGFWRLRRYRRHSHQFANPQGWDVEADVRVSPEIASPVTFGFRKPVVLLPASFPELHPRVRDAILCHECLHVRRGDWLYIVAEEVVRAVFWFHPAIWWLLGEIQLAREQVVDRAAVEMTNARDEYVDALLAVAGAKPALDLAPAPLFLRKRHLKTRVISVLKETHMSKKKLYSALAAGLCVLAAAGWMVTGAFPLLAAPQVVTDAPGITVDVGAAALMHRTAVRYPRAALVNGAEGTVLVQATLDREGNVLDAQVLSGPQELRRTALESVLQWHFAAGAGTTRQVSIDFRTPPGNPQQSATNATATQSPRVGTVTESLTVMGGPSNTAAPKPGSPFGLPIGSIEITGLPEAAKAELLAKLPVHRGDPFTKEAIASLDTTVKAFDKHLILSASGASEIAIRISAPGGMTTAARNADGQGQNIEPPVLIKRVNPGYPAQAKQERIQGRVVLNAVIAKDGTIKNLTAQSGPPLLADAAIEAVRQWVYKPVLFNGNPVEVATTIDINYALPPEHQ